MAKEEIQIKEIVEMKQKFQSEQKFNRDIDIVADAWGYADAFLKDATLTKEQFILNRFAEEIQRVSKDLRLQAVKAAVTVED
jgi:hypothetical protein